MQWVVDLISAIVASAAAAAFAQFGVTLEVKPASLLHAPEIRRTDHAAPGAHASAAPCAVKVCRTADGYRR